MLVPDQNRREMNWLCEKVEEVACWNVLVNAYNSPHFPVTSQGKILGPRYP